MFKYATFPLWGTEKNGTSIQCSGFWGLLKGLISTLPNSHHWWRTAILFNASRLMSIWKGRISDFLKHQRTKATIDRKVNKLTYLCNGEIIATCQKKKKKKLHILRKDKRGPPNLQLDWVVNSFYMSPVHKTQKRWLSLQMPKYQQN
jgi:hypothetical protein